MTGDIGSQLLKEVQRLFKEAYESDLGIGVLLRALETDRANYDYAGLYAQRVGEILARAYGQAVKSEDLPDGRMYWNIAQKVIQKPLVNNYNLIADACEKAQKAQNTKAGIGIKPIRPQLNQDRINGLMNKVSEAEHYDDVAFALDRPVVNAARSVVDDSVHANADFMDKSGLEVVVVRTPTGAHTCDWCKAVAGTYDYEKVKATGHEVWRRHLDCDCKIEYISRKRHEIVKNYRPISKAGREEISARKAVPSVGMPTREEIEARKVYEGEREKGIRDKKHSSGSVPGFGKYTQKDLIINADLVVSSVYRKKFDHVTDEPVINQALCNASRTMLMHRSGSDLEDMVLIDTKTGLIVGKQDRSTSPHQVDYNKSLKNAAEEYRSSGGLISVHNHNLSTFPSDSDLKSQYENNYDFGIIACHDGRLIKYKANKDFGDISGIYKSDIVDFYDLYYHKLVEKKYSGNIEKKAYELACVEAIEKLKSDYGFQCEVY